MEKSPRIAFFGSPELASKCLSILMNKFCIEMVVTRPDRARGRGQTILPTPVKKLACENNIPVYQPQKIKPDFVKVLEMHSINLIVTVAFGRILPPEIIHYPELRSMNLHASLLPRHRGPSPIQAAILNGETESGITIQLMDSRMDAGDIINHLPIPLKEEHTAEDLLKVIIEKAPDFLVSSIKGFLEGKLVPIPQQESEASYCSVLRKHDGFINWEENSEFIARKIRAFNIWPVAFTFLDGKKLRLYRAVSRRDSSGMPGEVIELDKIKGIIVKTGEGVVEITELQLENKRRMNHIDFINGYRGLRGKILGKNYHGKEGL